MERKTQKKIIYPDGKIESKYYKDGSWRKIFYNEYGKVIRIDSNEGCYYSANYNYDEDGLELTYEDSNKVFKYKGSYVTEGQFFYLTKNLTKAQYLGITNFPYIEKDNNDNIIYKELENGTWTEYTYDSKGRELSRVTSDNLFWMESYYDRFGRNISVKSNSPILNNETTYKNDTEEHARVEYFHYIHEINGEPATEAEYLTFIDMVHYSDSKFKPVTFEEKSIEFLKSKHYIVFKMPGFLIKFFKRYLKI